MEQKSVEYLINTLLNWSTADVRTVPGIMYQVLCKTNDTDNNIEYRFHWFIDCTETYVHNHRYTFDTYCLEGEYEERLWEIIDDHSGTSTYQFSRTSGNKFDSNIRVPGVLCNTHSRKHFPGNILHVDTHQFHSIVPNSQSDNHVLTFVARRICSLASKTTYVLSSSDAIKAPTDEIRPATSEERLNMYHKLQRTFQRILFKPAVSVAGGGTGSCTTDACRHRVGIIVGSIIGGVFVILLVIFGVVCYCTRCKGRSFRQNSSYTI